MCSWAGRFADDGAPYTDRVLPDGCIDIVWDGERVFVAGPDTRPVPLVADPGAFFAGIRFRPGLAPTVLGVAACELLDRRVPASALLGNRSDHLAERLHEASSLRAAALGLERALLAWLPAAVPPDRLVEAAVAALGAPSPASPVAALAQRLGISERQLNRRMTSAVGYGPKTLHRVLRFRRFLALATQAPELGLAQLALRAGYADQAHLCRDSRKLAGVAPTALTPGRPSSVFRA
ncbi:MAG: helix-turn-helix domain-containing protein [Egibacteraceae bacterium]